MRYATVRDRDGATTLLVGRDDGYLPLGRLASWAGRTDLAGIRDFGALVRADRPGRAAIAGAFAALEHEAVELPAGPLAPPVIAPGAIVCVGRNYLEHIREGGSPVPARPILFSKYPNTLVGHDEPVICHSITAELDYEGELAVIIGRRASRVPRESAMSFIAGFTIINDISARDLQLGDVQWIRGKSLDTFAPMGPVIITPDEVGDWRELRIQTRVNGEIRQDAGCSDMIFGIPELIAFITEGITLQPGDIVATGTPAGCGIGFDPPKWLQPGDAVEVSITGLGTLRSPIVEDPRR